MLFRLKKVASYLAAISIGAAFFGGPLLLGAKSEWSLFLVLLISQALLIAFPILTTRHSWTRVYSFLLAITFYIVLFLYLFLGNWPTGEVFIWIYFIFGFTGILLLYFLLPHLRYKSIKDIKLPDTNIKNIVASLFDTREFLTVLRTALPKGESDEEFGLDFIPYMLQSINEKRERFQKSSRRFLILTITMGVIFSSILMLFGYLLVNEAAAGLPRTLVHIEEATTEINTKLSQIMNQSLRDELTKENFRLDILIPSSGLSDPMLMGIDTRLMSAASANDPIGLQKTIEDGIQKTSDPKYQDVRGRLQELRRKVNDIIIGRQKRFDSIGADLAKLNTFQTNAENKLEASNYRVAEILKRTALGLIITTFFLAILRYVGGLYRDHYNQVLLAEQDDLAIRRFYIAFKCAKNNNDVVKSVLTQFMLNLRTTDKSEDGKGSDPTMNSGKIIEELVAALTKKL